MLQTRALRIVALGVLVTSGLGASLVPQATAEVPDDEIRLHLTDQPLWHSPGNRLDLQMTIENASSEPLEGFLLRVEGHPRVSSRSALHETFNDNPGFSISSFPRYFDEAEVAASASETVSIEEPVTNLTAIANAPGGGVFPVTVSLFDVEGSRLLDSVTTPLIYYPSAPDIPLNVVLAIPLNEIPARDAAGAFAADPAAQSFLLEEALVEDGWLSKLLDALERVTTPPPPPEPEPRRRRSRTKGEREARSSRKPKPPPPPPLRLALAPVPRFIEELADVADGYRREPSGELRRRDATVPRAAATALRRLRVLTERPGVQPLLVPYSFPDIPAISQGLTLEDGLLPQLRAAREVLAKDLGLEVESRWIFPPAGRLDAAALTDLRTGAEGFEHALFAEESFQAPTDTPAPGCPSVALSFTCPVAAGGAGTTIGLVTDSGIQDRFADMQAGIDPRLGVQNLFAETAMIREESPGVTGRVVQATIPSLWRPDARTIDLLLTGLQTAPWLRPMTPDEGIATGIDPGRRRLLPLLSDLDLEDPIPDLYDSIATTRDLVDNFALIRPPSALLERLSRNLLIAQSRLWGSNALLAQRADDFVDETAQETQREFEKITVGGTEEIRLTSQRGEIPIELFNDASYDVSVELHVVSPDLRLDETYPQVLQSGRFQQIAVDIAARSSGIFPVEVSVQTPGGSHVIDSKSIVVRSTEFNQIALIITIGALAFLVLFYVVRGIRKREHAAEDE